jgi:hypothetical protein
MMEVKTNKTSIKETIKKFKIKRRMIEVEIPVTNRVNLHFLGDKKEKKKEKRKKVHR